MFEFTRQPLPMLTYLEAYLADPYWCHATDVVPIIAATPAEAWPLWSEEELRDERVRSRLIRAPRRWRAFRRHNSRRVEDPVAALRQHLAAFIADIQGIPECRLHLVDVPDTEIEALAAAVANRLVQFALDVKGVDSPVLPSKTAHLLLLPLVPAFDRLVICNWVLWSLAPNACDLQSYVRLCWWVLQRFRDERTLEQARARVADHLLAQCARCCSGLTRPPAAHWLLRAMDTVVADYTLIAMARTVQDDYLLRWKVPPAA
jgi:hypothetical protein